MKKDHKGAAVGRLDVIEGSRAEGWAINPYDDEDYQVLDVFIDNEAAGTAKAGLYREDLARQGIRGGYAKFVYNIPARFHDGKTHRLELRHNGIGLPIENVPMAFVIGDRKPLGVLDRRDWAMQTLILRDDTTATEFAPAVRAAKRVALLSTYHGRTRFLLYHQHIIDSLIQAGFVVIVVHACDDRADWPKLVSDPRCFTIVKRNIGYDFGSWAVGVFALGEMVEQLDEIILINDSMVGLDSAAIAGLIARARLVGADAVGITESYERQYHLQSYLLLLKRRVCQSQMLTAFMAEYPFPSEKESVIVSGELLFSAWLTRYDFSMACLCPYESVAQSWLTRLDAVCAEIRDLPGLEGCLAAPTHKQTMFNRLDQILTAVLEGAPLNPSHFFWDTLLEQFDCGCLKRELVMHNPCSVPTHFRLGRVLAGQPAARAVLLDIRRHYGGHLIPVFWPGEPTGGHPAAAHPAATAPMGDPASDAPGKPTDDKPAARHRLEAAPFNQPGLPSGRATQLRTRKAIAPPIAEDTDALAATLSLGGRAQTRPGN